MTNMRRGFTMIELIFVIVIIGILAAVAIPKLSATRDDAKVSNIIANARTFIGDLGQFYTARGQGTWDNNGTVADATNVNLTSGTGCGALDENTTKLLHADGFSLCDSGELCIHFTATTGGSLEIDTTAAVTTNTVCQGVVTDPTIIGIVGTSGKKTQKYGGANVVR